MIAGSLTALMLQINATYEGALAALRKAGVTLVDVDVGHVEAYKEEHVPGEQLSLAVYCRMRWHWHGRQNKAAISYMCRHYEQHCTTLVNVAECLSLIVRPADRSQCWRVQAMFGSALPSVNMMDNLDLSEQLQLQLLAHCSPQAWYPLSGISLAYLHVVHADIYQSAVCARNP